MSRRGIPLIPCAKQAARSLLNLPPPRVAPPLCSTHRRVYALITQVKVEIFE